MTLRLVVALAILFGASAINPEASWAKFFKTSNAPKEQRFENFERAVRATIPLNIGMGRTCSSQFISSDGYLITAAHCIPGCLERHKLGAYSKNNFMISRDHRLFVNDLQKLPAKCELRMEGDLFSSDVELVALARQQATGQIADRAGYIAEDELEAEGEGMATDFAILRVPTGKSRGCVPIAGSPLNPGDAVWSMGFPWETMREEGFNSDGKSQFVSSGTVLCGPSETEQYQALLNGLPVEELQDSLVVALRNYGGDRKQLEADLIRLKETQPAIYTTADGSIGNSGGGLYNSRGELAGITVTGTFVSRKNSNPRTYHAKGAHTVLRIDVIRRTISENFGEEAAKRFFNCPPAK